MITPYCRATVCVWGDVIAKSVCTYSVYCMCLSQLQLDDDDDDDDDDHDVVYHYYSDTISIQQEQQEVNKHRRIYYY
jgi:hypothetical protein